MASQQSDNKRTLSTWIGASGVCFIAAAYSFYSLFPNPLQDGASDSDSDTALKDRLVMGVASVFLAGLWPLLGFFAVGGSRWQLETRDPSANPVLSKVESSSKEREKSARNSAELDAIRKDSQVCIQFLSNTVEQYVMFSGACLAASLVVSPSYSKVVPVCTAIWFIGRGAFWALYWNGVRTGKHTFARAIGLSSGLLSTCVLSGVAAVGLCLVYPGATNILVVACVSVAVCGLAILAVFPRVAPPVVPFAIVISSLWLYALFSGVVQLR